MITMNEKLMPIPIYAVLPEMSNVLSYVSPKGLRVYDDFFVAWDRYNLPFNGANLRIFQTAADKTQIKATGEAHCYLAKCKFSEWALFDAKDLKSLVMEKALSKESFGPGDTKSSLWYRTMCIEIQNLQKGKGELLLRKLQSSHLRDEVAEYLEELQRVINYQASIFDPLNVTQGFGIGGGAGAGVAQQQASQSFGGNYLAAAAGGVRYK